MSKNIKKPAHGTGEWAARNVNIDSGCPHRCKYCYASAMAIRFGRKTPKSWGIPEIDQSKVDKAYRKTTGRIMFPSSHDIHPDNLDAYLTVCKKVLAEGNDLLIVSKPHLDCIRRICAELAAFKGQIMFRFSIGSADNTVLAAWEPGAPSFAERLACLKHAYRMGYKTSVSCEPMLDANVHAVIKATKPFVNDSIWLGKANQLRQAVAINRPGDATARKLADGLMSLMTDEFVLGLYARYRHDQVIKFKDSIKKVVGLVRPTEKGMDV